MKVLVPHPIFDFNFKNFIFVVEKVSFFIGSFLKMELTCYHFKMAASKNVRSTFYEILLDRYKTLVTLYFRISKFVRSVQLTHNCTVNFQF